MTLTPQQRVARVVAAARQRTGLSPRELATRSGVPRTSIQRLEAGETVEPPKATVLAALAPHLNLPLADLYVAAGIQQPTELPSFTPYLRSRYRDLPASAQAELEQSFRDVMSRYGYGSTNGATGPLDGEDEADEYGSTGPAMSGSGDTSSPGRHIPRRE